MFLGMASERKDSRENSGADPTRRQSFIPPGTGGTGLQGWSPTTRSSSQYKEPMECCELPHRLSLLWCC